jgi:hypothetical protein
VADSLLDDVAARLDAALHHAQVFDDALERLRYLKSTLKVSIPVREIPLRTAAYAEALTRIGEAADAKGRKELYTS